MPGCLAISHQNPSRHAAISYENQLVPLGEQQVHALASKLWAFFPCEEGIMHAGTPPESVWRPCHVQPIPWHSVPISSLASGVGNGIQEIGSPAVQMSERTQRTRWLQDSSSPQRAHPERSTGKGSGTIVAGESKLDDVFAMTESGRGEDFWKTLILQHTKSGRGADALKLYKEMRNDGVDPGPHTFVALLKACSSLQDLKNVKEVHAEVVRSGLETDVYVGTMLVDVYAKCGSVENARRVFEEMPQRDVVSWNAMILGYAHTEKGDEALHLYAMMQQAGMAPNNRTYVGVLKACSTIAELGWRNGGDEMLAKQQCLKTVRGIHNEIEKGKFDSDVFVMNMLVDAYVKCASLEDARRVFEQLPSRNVVLWNTIILGYSQMEQGEEGLQLYSRMQQEGVVPDDRTYVSVLKACSTIAEVGKKNGHDKLLVTKQCLETVVAIHADVRRGGVEGNLFVGNMLVDAYSKCGSLESARRVFEEMPCRDVVSWNAMISGYAQVEKGEESLLLYTRMQQEGVIPDNRTYVAVLKACSAIAGLWGSMADNDMKQRCLEMVTSIHATVGKDKYGSDVFVGTMLVDAYAKCGSLENARNVFEQIPHRDVVSWNAMILGYAQLEKGEEALQLYTRMQQEAVVPDDRTYVGALNACGAVAGLEKGREIHAQIVKTGLDAGPFIANSLIDMYGKCASMVDAQQVFDAMPTREVVTWNALLVGYARQGESEAVFDLFNRMKEEGVQPDDVTFLAILSVCSHVGLVDTGKQYFDAMRTEYAIKPTIQTFNCLVDLLGRAGQVQKAMEMVKVMPFQANLPLWKSVLGACQKWGMVELGRHAFECAVKVDKSDAAPYVLMSNIYAAADMPEQAEQIQSLRVTSRAWKEPGRSWWTDMNGIAHVFVVGDQVHPESSDIYGKIGDLLAKMEAAALGYCVGKYPR